MTLLDRAVRRLVKTFVVLDGRQELAKLPNRGPALLVMNHINFLEAPLFYLWFQPRPVWALAKEELWNDPFFGVFVRRWGALPLKRGGTNLEAFNRVKRVLAQGCLVAMAPEGTRSKNGILQKGKAGAVLLAQETGVPLIPVAQWGGQNFWKNIRHLKRTTVSVRVGEPFTLPPLDPANLRRTRQEQADQIMQRLADLMPPDLRGPYG